MNSWFVDITHNMKLMFFGYTAFNVKKKQPFLDRFLFNKKLVLNRNN